MNKDHHNCRKPVKTDKKYRLWTFQSITSIEELNSKGIIEANWDRYSTTNQFLKPYQWMAKQMASRKISCDNNAPIWAWHSCTEYEKAPTLVDARGLLSDVEIEDGIQTIEFACPVELVLLSRYGFWNYMLHEIFPYQDEPEIDTRIENGLFEASRRKFRKYDAIQATMPYLKLDWVREIRALNLKPSDFTYNDKEEV